MMDLDDLRSELSDFAKSEKKQSLSVKEQRIVAGFEDIQRFYKEHKKRPQHGEDRDIFERLYATRLERLRSLTEYHELLSSLDHQGLLTAVYTASSGVSEDSSSYSVDNASDD